MTRFTDQLFDDLMREHGATLASTRVPPTPKRHLAARPVLLTAGAGGLAIAATVGTLVAGGGTPAYAVTTHPDGSVTLAVYQKTGIAQANARLHSLGDRVVVVPVGSGCPSITSLRAPEVPASDISVQASRSGDGSVTVAAQGVPAGDILVLGIATTTSGQFSMRQTTTSSGDHTGSQSSGSQSSGSGPRTGAATAAAASRLTSAPAPSCVSIPAVPVGSLPGSGKAGGGQVTCTHTPAPSVGHLPPVVQKGGRNPRSGGQASSSCSSNATTKTGSSVTSAAPGSASHGSG